MCLDCAIPAGGASGCGASLSRVLCGEGPQCLQQQQWQQFFPADNCARLFGTNYKQVGFLHYFCVMILPYLL